MDALQEGVEVEPPVAGDDDLPVEDDASERQHAQRGDELGKVARERLSALRLEHDALTLTKGEAAEPIPLRLERPLLAGPQRVHRERLHRRVRRPDGQVERREVDVRLHRAPVYAGWRRANRRAPRLRPDVAGSRGAPASSEARLEERRGKAGRSEEHTSELQSHLNLVCRLLLEKKKIESLYP